ncbi:MAG: rhodanese-like domain-containing protein, partial [Cyclobacteriaceae bacterium]|nr:rhodanese-like domain-containing protein [Cyclobacteriaceae bacterium]
LLITDGHFEPISSILDLEVFKENPRKFTVVDLRNPSEVRDGRYFDHAINIPLPELRQRVSEVPQDKPIIVHCAGGYRSAAGFSILEAALPQAHVLDLSEAVTTFMTHIEM